MIIQLTNIVAGALLAAPKVAEWGAKDVAHTYERVLAPYARVIGAIELGCGILALIERMGLIWLPIPNFGASYPQAIPAILVGLILCAGYFSKVAALKQFVDMMEPYKAWIGIAAFASGLNSILFGCWLCMY